MKKVLFTLVFVICCVAVKAQWSENPAENNQITPMNVPLNEYDFKVAPDGTTFIVFNRPYYNNNIATCIQIIDKSGKMLFPKEGKVISNELTRTFTYTNALLMLDKDNNAIVTVQDCRNSSKELEELSYSIYKISPTGEMLWGDKGIDLDRGKTYKFEAVLTMVQLEDESYVFGWQVRKDNLMTIQMQRLSTSGEFLWTENIEVKGEKEAITYPYLTNAGNNQVCLVYAKGSNQEIMVRKIDFDGSPVWANDARVYRGGFQFAPLDVMLSVTPDPKGGVFIGWYDDRSFTQIESTYVSYVKADGTLGFASGDQGEKVGYSEFRSFQPKMIYDAAEDCIYVVWRETDMPQQFERIMIQKITMTGELKWGAEGIELAPLAAIPVGYYSIQNSLPGEVAAFYMKYNEIKGRINYAVRLDKDGNFKWEESPLAITNSFSEKSELVSSKFIKNSYWLTAWKDERILSEDPNERHDPKIYMQKVNLDGTFGGSSISSTEKEIFTFAAIPSVVEENTQFVIDNKETGMIDLSLYTISGQKVVIVYHQEMDKGINEISWNAKSANIPSGVYIATLNTPTGSKSIRIVVK